MKKLTLLLAGGILLASSCSKKDSATPEPANSNTIQNTIHSMAKSKVVVLTSKEQLYMNWPGTNAYQCMAYPKAKCYEIYVSAGTSVAVHGDLLGDYTATATSNDPEDQLELHVCTPEGTVIKNVSEVTQTVDANNIATVTFK